VPFGAREGRLLASLVFVAGILSAPRVARAQVVPQETPVASLKELSVEDLINIEVTSVSTQPERLLDAPSAIQVISGDEIDRSGATSLPEALRLADNLEVAQKDANEWAISARGFNANLGDKLLVLIDGRSVYSPLYAGVLWNVQDYLLEDIDRVEVISGPGGTVWGANAVNGVINITTKSARDTQGLYVEEAAGNQEQDLTAVRFGGALAPSVFYRVYAEYSEAGSEDLTNGSSAGDSLRVTRTGFRLDSDASPQNVLTLQGDYYNGIQDYGPTQGEGRVDGANVLGRATHTFADDSDLMLQLYYDRTYLAQPYPAVAGSPPYVSAFPASYLTDGLDTVDFELQRHLQPWNLNKLVFGIGYRYTHEVDEDQNIVRFSPPVLDQSLYSGFIQDEIAVSRDSVFTIGTKLEHNDYTGFEWEPSARFQWNFLPKQMLWTAISRAVRTPSRYDRDLVVLTGLQNAPAPYVFPVNYLRGSPSFTSETEIAYELGYRAELAARVSVSVSTFYNSYNDLRSTAYTPTSATYVFPFPVVFGNSLQGHTYGAELTLNYQALDTWRLNVGYDQLSEHIYARPGFVDATGGLNETADPRNQVFLRSSMDLPHGVDWDASLRWIDSLTLDSSPTNGPVAGTVPSYFELDTRLAWYATRNLQISLVGQNLLHDHHAEYGFPSPTREEIVRGFYAKAELRY
jgi:iron complex outermembrane receptor protein